ncbi:MAG: heparinase II/III family protein [Myxococcota bacterium]
MKLKHAMTRIQKVRGDEWPYRVRQAQKNVQDLLFGHRAQQVSHPDTLPCWPVDIQLDDWKPQLYAQADQILRSEGKWLGSPWQLDHPWGWDPQNQWQWAMDCNPIGQLRQGPNGADPKFIWEILRLDGLLILALAGQAGHAVAYKKALELWRDLLSVHMPFRGILYTVGIENSFRLVKCLMLNQIFNADYTPEDRSLIWSFIWGHQQWIRRYPSRYSSGNNHRMSELAGLAVIEALAPHLTDAQPQKVAHEFVTHLQGLMHSDGVYAEQSLYYQATVMEWALVVACCLQSTDVYFPIQSVLGYMSQHLNSMLGEVGDCPMIGDNDDSHILPMLGSEQYIRSVAQSVSAFLDKGLPFEGSTDLRLLLFGLRLSQKPAVPCTNSFMFGGISQLHNSTCRVLIDHGGLGYERLAAHGHADALSVWAYRGAQPIWVDFGSYSYADSDWRSWARSTAAHNTVEINHQSSSQMLGGFGWKSRALSYVLSRDTNGLTVAHDGYEARFGVRHVRQVTLKAEGILIVDTIEGTGSHHVRLSYLLGEGLVLDREQSNQVIDAQGQKVVSFECDDETMHFQACYGDNSKEGWRSTGYMRNQPACRLIWSAQLVLPKRIEIFWRWS